MGSTVNHYQNWSVHFHKGPSYSQIILLFSKVVQEGFISGWPTKIIHTRIVVPTALMIPTLNQLCKCPTLRFLAATIVHECCLGFDHPPLDVTVMKNIERIVETSSQFRYKLLEKLTLDPQLSSRQYSVHASMNWSVSPLLFLLSAIYCWLLWLLV